MKTDAQILEYIETIAVVDAFGFIRSDLIGALSFDAAHQFFTTQFTQEEWKNDIDTRPVKDQIVVYLPFAIEKALNHRGLSAQRSLCHFHAWLWLDEQPELLKFLLDFRNYGNYGMPVLKKIAEHYKVEWPEDERADNMAQGLPCRPGCEEGCA